MTDDKRKILIIGGDISDKEEITQILKEDKHHFMVYTADPLNFIDTIYSEPPDLIIIVSSLKGDERENLCCRIRSDTVFGHLPIILVMDSVEHSHHLDWERVPVDDYLRKPIDRKDMHCRISMNFARAVRVRDANPLTSLPGNHSIMEQIQRRIDSGLFFAIAYVDLDHFKSYNDKYGFLRGDEIIKLTARLLTNSIRKLDSLEAFVGHVGGDDFVFIVRPDQLDSVCKEFIRNFDLVIGDFYDGDDRICGYVDSTNRKREKERFPIMSVSIAVVTNKGRSINHIGEVSTIAAQMKGYAKSIKGSSYVIDRREEKRPV